MHMHATASCFTAPHAQGSGPTGLSWTSYGRPLVASVTLSSFLLMAHEGFELGAHEVQRFVHTVLRIDSYARKCGCISFKIPHSTSLDTSELDVN